MKRVCLFTVFFLLVHNMLISQLFAKELKEHKQRILIVHSYHENQQGHVVEMTEGIEESLQNSNTERRYFFMDTKRKTSEAWKYEAGRQAWAIAEEFQPDIIITMDDNAQKYFAKDYAKTAHAPVIIFSGVNKSPSIYGFPSHNVTGVLERPNVVESLFFLKKILPQTKKILILSDKSPTTDGFVSYAKTQDLPLEVVSYEQVHTLDQWKAVLEQYRHQVDAIGLYVIRTIVRDMDTKEKVPETELVEYINTEIGMPTVGFFDSSAQAGVLCGISVSMHEQGYAAGEIAKKILAGKEPLSFTPQPTTKGRIQLNLRTAERFGITLKYNVIKRADVVVQ